MKGRGTINLRITCVISFYYGNSHIYCGKRLGTIIPRTRRNAKLYTKTLLHTKAFTHKHFCIQTLSNKNVFHAHTHRRISTQTLLHANTLTHRHFYTQTLLHTYAFTCRCFFTDAHILKRFYTQTRVWYLLPRRIRSHGL